jgi:hypothetical protein
MSNRFTRFQPQQYVDQYVPQPLDFINQGMSNMQKTWDDTQAEIDATKALTLFRPGLRTGHLVKDLEERYVKDVEALQDELIAGGNPAQVARKAMKFREKMARDEDFQQLTEDAAIMPEMVKQHRIIGEKGYNTVYQDYFDTNTGQFTPLEKGQRASTAYGVEGIEDWYNQGHKDRYDRLQANVNSFSTDGQLTYIPELGKYQYINKSGEKVTLEKGELKDKLNANYNETDVLGNTAAMQQARQFWKKQFGNKQASKEEIASHYADSGQYLEDLVQRYSGRYTKEKTENKKQFVSPEQERSSGGSGKDPKTVAHASRRVTLVSGGEVFKESLLTKTSEINKAISDTNKQAATNALENQSSLNEVITSIAGANPILDEEGNPVSYVEVDRDNLLNVDKESEWYKKLDTNSKNLIDHELVTHNAYTQQQRLDILNLATRNQDAFQAAGIMDITDDKGNKIFLEAQSLDDVLKIAVDNNLISQNTVERAEYLDFQEMLTKGISKGYNLGELVYNNQGRANIKIDIPTLIRQGVLPKESINKSPLLSLEEWEKTILPNLKPEVREVIEENRGEMKFHYLEKQADSKLKDKLIKYKKYLDDDLEQARVTEVDAYGMGFLTGGDKASVQNILTQTTLRDWQVLGVVGGHRAGANLEDIFTGSTSREEALKKIHEKVNHALAYYDRDKDQWRSHVTINVDGKEYQIGTGAVTDLGGFLRMAGEDIEDIEMEGQFNHFNNTKKDPALRVMNATDLGYSVRTLAPGTSGKEVVTYTPTQGGQGYDNNIFLRIPELESVFSGMQTPFRANNDLKLMQWNKARQHYEDNPNLRSSLANPYSLETLKQFEITPLPQTDKNREHIYNRLTSIEDKYSKIKSREQGK